MNATPIHPTPPADPPTSLDSGGRLGAMPCSVSSVGRTPAENKRERSKRWYMKLKNNPEKLAKRKEKQRASERNRPDRKQKQREEWASLPANHHRKTSVNLRTKRARAMLTDSVVSHALGLKVSQCPKELIELKRASMMLCRKLKTRIKTA